MPAGPGGWSGARLYGATLVFVASVLWSTAGLFVGLIHVDVWTMLAWRALFGALSLLLILAFTHRRRLPRAIIGIGWPGLMAVPITAVSMLSYVVALKLTTVANVLTVYSTIPFVAAGIAFLWMGEPMRRRALIASGMAFCGVLVMAGSATRPGDLAGNGFAFLMTFTFSILVVMARRYRSLEMASVNALGALLCAAVCWPLIPGGLPSAGELGLLALFGTATTGLAYLLFLTGGRHIPPAEAGLIGLCDLVLGPLWVWLALGQEPGRPALIGGAIVLASVAWYLAGGRGRSRPELAA